DYEDFLRQRGLEQWEPEHPALKRFKARRCSTLDEVRAWVNDEREHWLERTNTDAHRKAESVGVSVSQKGKIPPSSQLVANAALSLLNICCYLLDRQLAAQAEAFKKEGGFTERLYKIRSQRRRKNNH
ncbi:MAG: four helix bundle protein, partial [Calditrichaeota bacterium]